MNLGAILEKIAADFYAFFQKKYRTPETCLSLQLFLDDFTRKNEYAIELSKKCQIDHTLRFMTKFVDGYQDLALATTDLNGKIVSIREFILNCHRPPEEIFFPDGKLVPLKGMMELCAAIHFLADIEGLGGELTNAGFVWEKKEDKIISARVVKVDPGASFDFALPKAGSSCNWALLTSKRKGSANHWLTDIRNIQIALSRELTLQWLKLTDKQQIRFLDALNSMLNISKEDLFYGFYREGAFERNNTEHISKNVAEFLVKQMIEWIELQKQIYKEELMRRNSELHYPLDEKVKQASSKIYITS